MEKYSTPSNDNKGKNLNDYINIISIFNCSLNI